MFSVATVFLLLASLVAAAGFAVIAQRRLRQLGMLAAIGATEKHLRLVLLANGAVVGAIGALIGTVAGLALWLALAPTLETAVGHRIDRLSLPWSLLARSSSSPSLGATAAAWWPGRTVARVPVMLALSGRPPRPKPAHRSAIVGRGADRGGNRQPRALRPRPASRSIIAGLLATILGTLLLGPLAIRLFARVAGHAPIAPRLALRDLARYQARSGAALAAITLALGIAAAVVVIAAAEEKRSRQARAAEPVRPPDPRVHRSDGDPELIPSPIQTPAQLERRAARVRQLAGESRRGGRDPAPERRPAGRRPMVTVRERPGARRGRRAPTAHGQAPRMLRRSSIAALRRHARPARHLGIDPATVDPSADFLADPAVPTDELVISDIARAREAASGRHERPEDRQPEVSSALRGRGAGLAPSSFVTLDGLRRHGWEQVPAGWLVESSRPLTSEQIAAARELAADAGLTIEAQRESTSHAKPSPSQPPQAPSWRSRSSP